MMMMMVLFALVAGPYWHHIQLYTRIMSFASTNENSTCHVS